MATWLPLRWPTRRQGIGLLIIAVAMTLVTPQAIGWYCLFQGRQCLQRFHPEAASRYLATAITVLPGSAEARLLASRAARQQGELAEAARQLRQCQYVGGSNLATAMEWALLQAWGGNQREVEEFLHRRADQDRSVAPLVWEALIEGHVRVYRILDALALADYWLQVDPDNVRALELRGLAYQHGKATPRGVEDLRRVIELEPTRDASRRRLVLGLLSMGSYEEALTHLEYLDHKQPRDPEIQVRIARCHNLLGRSSEARKILDAVVEEYPEHALALRTRAQFALADRRPDLAEGFLRRATTLWPTDYQTHWLLLQALQQQDRGEEVRVLRLKTEQLKDQAERLGELSSRKLSEQPLDPALHYEMGILLLRAGHTEAGVGWLLSALNLSPDHAASHRALADHYERIGNTLKAQEHLRQATVGGS